MTPDQPSNIDRQLLQENHNHDKGDACPKCFMLGVKQGREEGRRERMSHVLGMLVRAECELPSEGWMRKAFYHLSEEDHAALTQDQEETT